MIIFLSFCYDSYSDERLVSQETVLLHGWGSKTLNFGIKEVSKGQISAPGCYTGGREFKTPTRPTLRVFK